METSWLPQYYQPEPLELASSTVVGLMPDAPAPLAQAGGPARSVLEGLIVGALQRPPCVIGFSGGRDSSAILALAAWLARREGLDLPIPITFRYHAEEAEAEESSWQELVVRHVGVDDWEIVEVGTRHDMVGPLARPFLVEHGLVFPATLYNNTLPLLRARGGSHMSGEGGDEIFGVRRSTIMRRALADPRYFLHKRHLRHAAMAFGPRTSRRATLSYIHRKLLGPCLSYLLPEAAREVIDRVTADALSEPFNNEQSLRWHLRRKQIILHQGALVAFSKEHDVYHLDPFLEPRFVAAYARMVSPLGLPSRTDAMRALFGDLLPDEVLCRTSKALFNRGFLTDLAREFAASWRGGGIDTDIVRPEALRAAWLSDWPPSQSFWLLQAAWLHENRGGLSKPR